MIVACSPNSAVTGHGMHEPAVDGDLERPLEPGHRKPIDAEIVAEPAHQGVGEGEGLRLIAALGAVDDPHPGAHRACGTRSPTCGARAVMSRMAMMTWRFAHGVVALRRAWISAISRPRTSSSSARRRVGRSELGVLRVDGAAVLLAALRDADGPLDEHADLVPVGVEEGEHRQRLEPAMVEVAGREVGDVGLDEAAELEGRPDLARQDGDDRQVGDDVATPVLDQGDARERPQRSEVVEVTRIDRHGRLRRIDAFAVLGHGGLEGLVGHPGAEARRVHERSHPPVPHRPVPPCRAAAPTVAQVRTARCARGPERR